MAAKTQKVTLSVTIEVDVEAWDLAYGRGTSAEEIRDDVRSYFINVIRAGEAGDGAVVAVTDKY
jgi:hypothetical protein